MSELTVIILVSRLRGFNQDLDCCYMILGILWKFKTGLLYGMKIYNGGVIFLPQVIRFPNMVFCPDCTIDNQVKLSNNPVIFGAKA